MANEFEQADDIESFETLAETENQNLEPETQEFFADSAVGQIKAETPDSHETMFFQAEKIAAREQTVRDELEESDQPVQDKIETGKQVMAETKAAFTEAKNVQEIIDQLSSEGKIFKALDFDIRADSEVPNQGLHFVVTPESVSNIKQAAAKLGYRTREIKGKGIVIEASFTTYTFLTGKNLDQKALTIGEKISEDDDDEDEESTTTPKIKIKSGAKARIKKGKVPKSLNSVTRSDQNVKTSRPKLSPGEKITTETNDETIFDLPPVASGPTSSQSTPPTPELKSPGQQTPSPNSLETSAGSTTAAPQIGGIESGASGGITGGPGIG